MTIKIEQSNVEDILPLLPLQKNMLYYYMRESNPELYNEINCYKLKGKICTESFKQAWKNVFSLNGILRTIFRWEGLREPVQVVLKEIPIDLEIEKIEDGDLSKYYKRFDEIFYLLKSKRFDLKKETLRIKLLIQDEENAIMITANHHILFDGWSNAILLNEFKMYYEDLIHKKSNCSLTKTCYTSFIHSYVKEKRNIDYDYWSNYLSSIKLNRDKEDDRKENKVFLSDLSSEISQYIESSAKMCYVSPAVYFYFAWAITLKIIEEKNDVVFGITLSGRTEPIYDIEKVACLLISTLPFTVKINEEKELYDSLIEINNQLNNHQDKKPYSIVDLYSKLNITSSNLYNSVIVIQNYPTNYDFLQQDRILGIDLYKRFYKTNLDINLSIRQFKDTKIDIEYNAMKYREEEIFKIYSLFVDVLKELCMDNRRALKDLLQDITHETKNNNLKEIGEFNF